MELDYDLSRFPTKYHAELRRREHKQCARKGCQKLVPWFLMKSSIGQLVLATPSKYARRVYCSQECHYAARNVNPGAPRSRRRSAPREPLKLGKVQPIVPMRELPRATPKRGGSATREALRQLRLCLRAHDPEFLDAFRAEQESAA